MATGHYSNPALLAVMSTGCQTTAVIMIIMRRLSGSQFELNHWHPGVINVLVGRGGLHRTRTPSLKFPMLLPVVTMQ
jgi:hypothetical protein